MFKLVSNTATLETATENAPASAAVANVPVDLRFCIPLLGFREPVSASHNEQQGTTDAATTPELKNSGVAA